MDTYNYAGISNKSSDGYDDADVYELTPMPADYLMLYFPHPEWGDRTGNYTQDVRSNDLSNWKEWPFEVKTEKGGRQIELIWPNISSVPGGYELKIVDIDGGGKEIDPRQTSSYVYTSGEIRHFLLSVRKTTSWDVNGDDSIDILDLALIGQRFGEEVEEGGFIEEDVNGDGMVDISDLILVARHFGEGTIKAIASLSEIVALSGKEANVRMDVRNKIGIQGTRLLQVDIIAEQVKDLYGVQFDLLFDPKVLKVVGIQPGDILAKDGASTYWNVAETDNKTGKVIGATYVRKATKKGVNASGTLATVTFDVKNVDPSDETMLNLGNIKLADADAHLFKVNTSGALLNWEKLLVPEKIRLLQNYPNPFNPDTWIPYQLNKDAEVIVKVYSINGQLIRTLDLGRKPAGFYMSKERAAHWDGRNEAGESVSSDIYFYQIQAGNFTTTRKMIVVK